jgi:muconolactone delta-isomerase
MLGRADPVVVLSAGRRFLTTGARDRRAGKELLTGAAASGQVGKWAHIWRIVGAYANFSIFDVESNDELHTLLSGLPLFSCMDIHVTPRATQPSDIKV